MRDRLHEEAQRCIAVLRSGPATARSLTDLTGLSRGRIRFVLAYMLGAKAIRGDGEHPATWTLLDSKAIPDPQFDHVYAAIEDCMVWLSKARMRIDGEPVK